MATFKFYSDAALTTPVTAPVQVSEGTNTFLYYLGSTDSTKKLHNATTPGVGDVVIGIADLNPGSGPEDTWVILGKTLAELDVNTPGDDLSLGTVVYGGSANSVPIYVKIANTLSGATSSNDLSIQLIGSKEFAV